MINLSYAYTNCRDKEKKYQLQGSDISLAKQQYFVNESIKNSNVISVKVSPLSLEGISSAMAIHRHKVLGSVSWVYEFVLHTVLYE